MKKQFQNCSLNIACKLPTHAKKRRDGVQIYRIAEKENSPSFIHDEVCRSCALEFQNKGLSIEIDGYLQKYVYEEYGVTYYEDGSDDENPEIQCSICGEYLISEDDFLNERIKRKRIKKKVSEKLNIKDHEKDN